MGLQIKSLFKSYGARENKVTVLNNIDLNVEQGEMCVLIGPSGSGKSTLLNIIGGIDVADSGEVSINGQKIENMNEKSLTTYRRKHLGYVFQMYNLIPNLNLKENIEVGSYLSKDPLEYEELVELLGLKEHQYKMPNQLSGGQQQRTAIGRAIIKNPSILLCDEPTGALDYKTSKAILNLLEEVNIKYNTTIIIVTHNEAIKNMADRIVTLKDGKILKNYKNNKKISARDLEW
ncbi:putative ABC transport system ATP-binding protein [Lachnospiraceae bacterium C7]|nr:putative ABC transport system ATP-binding protein [Lachnospiraceae bacterium C7]